MTTVTSSKLSYLQKYLSAGDSLPGANEEEGKKAAKKKKKKKKDRANRDFLDKYRCRIIDEDESFLATTVESNTKERKSKEESNSDDPDDRFDTQEDRPQVAGYVDERPEIEIMKERFTTSTFQPVIKVEDDDDDEDQVKDPQTDRIDLVKVKEEPLSEGEEDEGHGSSWKSPLGRKQRHDSSDGGDSPGRRRRRHESSDESPPRRRRRHDSSDESPPRRRRRHDSSDSDSPPKRQMRHDSSDDAIEPRKRRMKLQDNASPVRAKREPLSEEDQSPPRRSEGSKVRHVRKQDSDISPPRRTARRDSDGDISPPRRNIAKDSDGDISPPRRRQRVKQEPEDDLSPPRMTRTLDGKKAGLQDARSMKQELDQLKKMGMDKFNEVSRDVSGKGAETKVRGRLKEKEEEKKRKEKEHGISEEVKQKYSRWSKGVKQAEEIAARISEDLREMSKPLARSAEDVDMNDHLRDIDRQEDPMLEYIKKKRAKKAAASAGGKVLPTYKGPPPPPNRFAIPPGYRWDGVDRSNGFEKKLFERQNARKAVTEDIYKWSTEDM